MSGSTSWSLPADCPLQPPVMLSPKVRYGLGRGGDVVEWGSPGARRSAPAGRWTGARAARPCENAGMKTAEFVALVQRT
ncbi:MAG: hypothetical protein LBQ79_02145 [Deltaproteobacteria bacterium]|nr:hypothetical protein [Deltaproteobacteria bacterium]